LLLGFQGNQGGAKENTISGERVAINGITRPSRIRVRLKLERTRAREEKAARDGPTKISQNTMEVSIVKLGRSQDKLTQDMNRVSNIRMGDPKIDKTPNKLTIARGIKKWCTVSGLEANTKFHRSVNRAVISESSMRKKVLSVLLLGEKNTIRCGGDLKTK
jgi:hypothetical protein